MAALTHLTVLVHVHKAGSSQTAVLPVLFIQPLHRILRTIRRTLIFKQFKKNNILPFLLLDCKARLKKILRL